MRNGDIESFYDHLRHTATFESIGAVLGWDEQTGMPSAGTNLRADQQGLIARLTHQQATDPKIADWLAELESDVSALAADPHLAANVRETRRSYDRLVKLPPPLVEELTRTAVHSQAAWTDAKRTSRYETFSPWLEKTLALKRQEAECYGYAQKPYDALLDTYEPGETAASVSAIFETFRKPTVALVAGIVDSGRKAPLELVEQPFPLEAQQRFAREAAEKIGYDFSAGRVDVAVHPFCTGIGPGDTRITTRFDANNFADAFFSVLHEAGHAMYEQGLPKSDRFGQPVAEAISLGIHESQSRMWENLVGRGGAFWKYFFPRVKAMFPDALRDARFDDWVFAMNDTRPSLIRTESDETTYNLHVILRFELEQALLADEIKPRDLPVVWNERMKQYFNLTPPDDARGCMQDVHWSAGLLGYFPTYALGNLYAAQFFEQARLDLGDLDGQFAAGEFAPLLGWLRDKIHRHGKLHRAGDLVQRVTGKPLSADAALRHLRGKAERFYGVKA